MKLKIQKFQADEEGIIRIPNCVSMLTMGLQENIVTIWAAIDETGKIGIKLASFTVKYDGDTIEDTELEQYVTSFINDTLIAHLFAEKPKPSSIKMSTNPEPDAGGSTGKILL